MKQTAPHGRPALSILTSLAWFAVMLLMIPCSATAATSDIALLHALHTVVWFQVSNLDRPDEDPAPARPAANGAPGTGDTGAARPAAKRKTKKERDDSEPVCDLLKLKQAGKYSTRQLRLDPTYHERFEPLLEYTFYLRVKNETGEIVFRVKGEDINEIDYYEIRMLSKAREALGIEAPQITSARGVTVDLRDPARVAAARRAEKILDEALAEHDSAVQRQQRDSGIWERIARQPILNFRFNLQLSQINALLAQGAMNQAEEQLLTLLGQANAGAVSGSRAANKQVRQLLLLRFEQIFRQRAEQAFASENFEQLRQMIDEMDRRFLLEKSPACVEFRERMIALARQSAAQAEKVKTTNPNEASRLIERAALVWPALPGLDEQRRRWETDFQTLACAYAELPDSFSPLHANSAIERHLAALLFEGLVRNATDAEMGQHYEAELAELMPEPEPRGRKFLLNVRQWSDSDSGQPVYCTVDDVRWTIQMLQNKKLPGYCPGWSQLMDGVEHGEQTDPFEVLLRLQKDYWQPLSLMKFKVLPKHLFPNGGETNEWNAFDRAPVGTGLYRLVEQDESHLRLVANPNRQSNERPVIREISVSKFDSLRAVDLFAQRKLHLVYGLRPEHVTQLEQQRRTVRRLSTPTVWFLAPNHRRQALQNQNLRLGIAHAIDRKLILESFRPNGRKTDHAELHGPYPLGSWAHNPKALQFNPSLAWNYLHTAKIELVKPPALSLIYPADEPEVETACKLIQSQLEPHGIILKLQALGPRELASRVMDTHDFDLAYWHYDFTDETYWLWPLLDPSATGPHQANVMGYSPDDSIIEFFRNTEMHKQFPVVRQWTHKVHDHVARTAAIIPLWQLDTYVALDDTLAAVPLDPVYLFSNVKNWQLKK
ncbi:MAG: ABC transporter substrate-binding protein [Planctomycetes bacterium]|nr:ABC transporter substrate-binding protein [Planctomycetota bacterium]